MSDAIGKGRLMVISGPAMGKTVTIELGQETTIGSDPSCQVCIKAPGVSPIHARIAMTREGASIEDTQSPLGIFVNNKRVDGTTDLHNAAIVSLGPPADAASIKLQWKFKAVAAPEPASPEPLVLEETLAPAPPASAAEDTDLGGLLIDAAQAPEFVLDEPVPAAPMPAAAPPPVELLPAPAPPPAAAAPTPPAAVPPPPAPPPPPVPPPVAAATAPPPAPAAPAAPPPVAPPASAKPAVTSADASHSAGKLSPPPPKPPPPPRPAAPEPAPAAVVPPLAAAPSVKPRPRLPLAVVIGVVASLLTLTAVVVIVVARPRTPRVQAIAPTRVSAGEIVTITGHNFGKTPTDIVVSFGDLRGRVAQVSDDDLKVEVPAVPITPGRLTSVPVTVGVKGRRSSAAQVTIYELPRITGITPAAAEAGDEVVISGSGFALNSKVLFSKQPGRVVEAKPTTLRVTVPETPFAAGGSVPVTVTVDADASAAFPLLIGHLPLIASVEPAGAAPGDTVIIKGRGFGPGATVRIGSAEAVVSSTREDELKVVVPAAAPGEAVVEVRMPESERVGRANVMLSSGAPAAAAPGPLPSVPPLRLQGAWAGTEKEGDFKRFVTVTFSGFGGGSFRYDGMGLTLPIRGLQPTRGTPVRFTIQRGAVRYYYGTWDGQKVNGTISFDPEAKKPIGTFELAR